MPYDRHQALPGILHQAPSQQVARVRACGSAGCGHRAYNRRTFGPIPRWARHDHAGDCHDQHGRTALNDLIESAFPRPGGARIGFGAQRMRLGLRSTAVLPGWPGTSTRRPGPQTPIPATAISVRLCHPATASTRATAASIRANEARANKRRVIVVIRCCSSASARPPCCRL
jgi:hypothetical protein